MSFSPAAVLKGVGRRLRGIPTPPNTRSERAYAGEDIFLRDARSAFPGYAFETVFDVGAHVGAVSSLFRARFPDASIHAFEPGPEAFAALAAALGSDGRFDVNRLALSGREGVGAFAANGAATTNRLTDRPAKGAAASRVIEVEVATGDGYCTRRGVGRISFLKIDTEGHDLDVLFGFEGMLRAQAVDLIQVEAGMNPENRRHVPFGRLTAHLEERGYRLFRLYEQRGEKRLPVLRRCNAVFVSQALAEAHRRS